MKTTLFKETTLTIQDIEKICINYIHNQLYWYEKETRDFFDLVEKPLNFSQDIFLNRIFNDLTQFDAGNLEIENLTNENLQYPFSKLHNLVNYYVDYPTEFFKEIFENEYESTHLSELLTDKFYLYAEQVLNENEKFNKLNEDLQVEIISKFTPFEHINKQDAIILLNLLVY